MIMLTRLGIVIILKNIFKDDDAVDSVKNILIDDLVKYEKRMNEEMW